MRNPKIEEKEKRSFKGETDNFKSNLHRNFSGYQMKAYLKGKEAFTYREKVYQVDKNYKDLF